jgi:hypothetical protein
MREPAVGLCRCGKPHYPIIRLSLKIVRSIDKIRGYQEVNSPEFGKIKLNFKEPNYWKKTNEINEFPEKRVARNRFLKKFANRNRCAIEESRKASFHGTSG